MAEYINKEQFDRKFIIKMLSPKTTTIFDVKNIIDELPNADVIERSKVNETIEEIEQTLYVDSLIFGELIDFKNGKISADDVIEEFNKVIRKEVLEILRRNIGE